jgi:hypothetical protein
MHPLPIVQASLLTILKLGLPNIRCEAWRKNSERCAIEADHLHNIPGLLEDFSIDLLKYYVDIERLRYVREINDQVLEEIRNAWTDLTHWLSKQ